MIKILIGIILILIGLTALTGLSLVKFFFFILLILIGVKVILSFGDNSKNPKQSFSTEEEINEVIIFGGISKAIICENFKGGKVVSIFGGFNIDLSEAKTNSKELNLEITTVLGGGRIKIPKNWKVNIKRTSILGGHENKTKNNETDTTINIEGASILGGLEIFN